MIIHGNETFSKKINTKLQFLYRQHKFINPKLCCVTKLLCSYLIQPHFDYACVSCYPLVSQKIRKIQVTQNTYMHHCLKLNTRQHKGVREFKRKREEKSGYQEKEE